MNGNALKGLIAFAAAAVGAYFRELAGPIIMLAVVMVLDYCTGLVRAWIERKISSRIGIVGVIKKVGYLCVVAVAIVVDWTIQSAAATMGHELGNFYMFGLLVTFWLVLNECISILENTSAIGVPMPGFLMKIVEKLKQTADEKGEEVSK